MGLGSRNRVKKWKTTFFNILNLGYFKVIPKILSPNPHPKCLKLSCEVGVPLEWARTKASRFGRFYQTCLVRLGHYTFPSLSVLVPTERARLPLSNHRAQFSNILCQQAPEPITMALSTGVIVNNCRQARHVVRMLAADWTRAHALARRPFLKGQTSAGFSNACWGLSRSHVQ